jgi:hypothetical protein
LKDVVKSIPLRLPLLAALVLGCANDVPDVVLENRTETLIAVAPGILLEPCSSTSYSEMELRAAGERLLELSQNDVVGDEVAWIPAGAARLDGIPPSRVGEPRPYTLVIRSDRAPEVTYGPVEGARSPCGGLPVLWPSGSPAP